MNQKCNFSNRFETKLLRRPLYKGQMAHPQCVFCWKILLYRSVPQIRPPPSAFLAQSLAAEVFLSQLLRGSVLLPRPSKLKLISLPVVSGASIVI